MLGGGVADGRDAMIRLRDSEMSHRDSFIAALDANPSDQVTRAIFADWLEENGEYVLSACLRWMVAKNKCPSKDVWIFGTGSWNWWFDDGSVLDDVPLCCRVPLLRGDTFKPWFAPHSSRHAAEVALAEALWNAGITKRY